MRDASTASVKTSNWSTREGLIAVSAALIAGAVAVLAHARWPYHYYEVFRWIIAIAAITCGYQIRKKPLALALCVTVAVVFNPIAPPRMRAYQWERFDILAAVVMFGVAAYVWNCQRLSSRA